MVPSDPSEFGGCTAVFGWRSRFGRSQAVEPLAIEWPPPVVSHDPHGYAYQRLGGIQRSRPVVNQTRPRLALRLLDRFFAVRVSDV
ncbi:hypothetical protein DFJ75_2956 [Williamsia muralis]|uniref:Uncharacterized protein n=1 Tax=Williamsia marianensis TaxID=85044 RepID=A0A495K4A4_WILMA|nr:hypothetical protein DFJ75_2956 [Williamsia muralis]